MNAQRAARLVQRWLPEPVPPAPAAAACAGSGPGRAGGGRCCCHICTFSHNSRTSPVQALEFCYRDQVPKTLQDSVTVVAALGSREEPGGCGHFPGVSEPGAAAGARATVVTSQWSRGPGQDRQHPLEPRGARGCRRPRVPAVGARSPRRSRRPRRGQLTCRSRRSPRGLGGRAGPALPPPAAPPRLSRHGPRLPRRARPRSPAPGHGDRAGGCAPAPGPAQPVRGEAVRGSSGGRRGPGPPAAGCPSR